MDYRLKNKVAIVTGGSTGIGEAICKKFTLEGAKVLVCGLPDDPVDEVAKEIFSKGGTAIAYKGDISLAEHAKICIDVAINTWGKLDILINNAGVFPTMDYLQDYPIDAFEYLVKNNVHSVFMMTKFALPHLQKSKGCIVSAGSESGLIGIAENTPYGGTKGFIHSFMKGVAAEQAQFGVRANCVCPGPIDTAWTHKETGPMSAKHEKLVVSATPMGRRGTPEEVANVYLFLASDEASYVTGALYTVDGGITINKGSTGAMADKAMKAKPEGELHLEHSQEGDTAKDRYNKVYNSSQAEAEKNISSSDHKFLNTITKTLIGVSVGIAATKALLNISKNQSIGKEVKQPEAGIDTNIPQENIQSPTPATDEHSDIKLSIHGLENRGWDKQVNYTVPGSAAKTGGNPIDKGFMDEAAIGNNE